VLFDLRSRGRRRTVQGVYLGLALLMGGGLVLFGVGAGNGLGGLLNAFTGNGSGNNQKQVVSQQEKAALRQTRQNPSDPAGWAALVQARWTSAGQGANFDPNTGQFTAAGKKELASTTAAWQKYLTLTNKPDPNVAIFAARAYGAQANYAGAATAWEVQANANPTIAKGFECLAATAYAANQSRKGDLAMAKALTLVPKAQRLSIKQTLQQAKTNPQVAQSC
jgi:hypothetical protein